MAEIVLLRGEAIAARLDDLARLRIAVFRDWPYLYDGDPAYERDYLRHYAAPGALVVAAMEGGRMVGAATAAPLEDHAADFADALSALGHPPDATYYLAESVLLPEARGQGIGHRFFDAREAEARALGRRFAAFCAVLRPDDHPARPAAPRTHDTFWRGRGYRPVEGAVATFRWRDVGEAEETPKPLQFWGKPL